MLGFCGGHVRSPHCDGVQAVESATRACKVSDWKDPMCLITLAAAHAEAGDFDLAEEWAGKAIALLPADHPNLNLFRQCIDDFKQKRPHREPQ